MCNSATVCIIVFLDNTELYNIELNATEEEDIKCTVVSLSFVAFVEIKRIIEKSPDFSFNFDCHCSQKVTHLYMT